VTRPTPGSVEERTAPESTPTVDGRRLRGVIPYGVESRDLGGWREVIDAGALNGTDFENLIATREHDRGKLLGRHPGTLEVEDRADGFAWSVELPSSPVGDDVRVAVERGDLRSTSWRMVVARDRWDGDLRHIEAIGELLDVTITAAPAYGPAALAELRAQPEPPEPAQREENPMPEERTEQPEAGGLQVEDRTVTAPESRTRRGLARAFRESGFPGETATVEWGEFRAATFSGSLDGLAPVRAVGVDLGADQRYAWPVFPQVTVDAGDTSVQVLSQSARTLPAPADVVRAIDAVTTKPEVASTLAVVATALKQVAAIESNIPNVYLEQPAFNSVIETDLRLALNEGLDKLVLDAVAASGYQAPGTDPLLISIRKAMTVLLAAGYNPDVVVLTPANAEALDTLRATATAAEQYYVFAPAELAPRKLFGLSVRVSKTAAAPFVADSGALGKLYISPITLARFEVDAGATNRSNVRLEGHGVFGVERQAAAVRIAAA
jgi:HK97 family phage prohead protease